MLSKENYNSTKKLKRSKLYFIGSKNGLLFDTILLLLDPISVDHAYCPAVHVRTSIYPCFRPTGLYMSQSTSKNGMLKGCELQASTFQGVLLVKPNGNSLKYLRKTRCTVQILPWRRLAPFNYIIKHHTSQSPVVQSRRQIKVPEAYKSECTSQLYIIHNCSHAVGEHLLQYQ